MATIKTVFGTIERPLRIGNSIFECYILENKLRVISIESIQKSFGYDGQFKNWFLGLLNDINIYFPISTEILEAFKNPIKAEIQNKIGQNITVLSIDAKQIISVCKIIVKVKNEGLLSPNQVKIGKTAQLILDNTENSNINILIDEASGFNIYKIQVVEKCINSLKTKQTETPSDWIKTFPIPFLECLLEMNALEWTNIDQNPEMMGNIINEVVFSRIDDVHLEDLCQLKPKRAYRRKNGLKQELEHPELKKQIAAIESLAKAAGYQWNIFIQLLNKAYPKQKNRIKSLCPTFENKKNIPLSDFNAFLMKTLTIKPKN